MCNIYMVRTLTSINLDLDVKNEAMRYLKEKGWTLTFFLEQSLRKLNEAERIKKEEVR